MKCRICHSPKAGEISQVEYLAGYAWKVFDCPDCLCRFTEHDGSIHDRLHVSGAISYYGDYRELAGCCKAHFGRGDIASLKTLLRRNAKYRFVLEEIEREPRDARLLEVGCSRGYLTSAFILEGRKILGVDTSAEAVESARSAFGDHFAVTGASAIAAGAPYDVIYHVGMIGCVADPLGLTRSLLGMLKPGGRLLFNAPNRESCYLRGQLWIDSAPPPDVVTLFAPGFWKRHCAEEAEVEERTEMWPVDKGVEIGLRKLFGRRWREPATISLTTGRSDSVRVPPPSNGLWRKFERGIVKVGRVTGLSRFAPSQPSEFGLFVKMTRRANH